MLPLLLLLVVVVVRLYTRVEVIDRGHCATTVCLWQEMCRKRSETDKEEALDS